MNKRKSRRAKDEEYCISSIELVDYKASVDASINYEVRDPQNYNDHAKVYSFNSQLLLNGVFKYPDERFDEIFEITIYGNEPGHSDFALTLKDCHVRDDEGTLKYRKVRGKELPVYEIPKGIGYLERRRGEKNWTGVVWVSQQTVTDMLTLLPSVQPLFLSLHEQRINRTQWIIGLTLQTSDSEEE